LFEFQAPAFSPVESKLRVKFSNREKLAYIGELRLDGTNGGRYQSAIELAGRSAARRHLARFCPIRCYNIRR
jgi:hypothetical protein